MKSSIRKTRWLICLFVVTNSFALLPVTGGANFSQESLFYSKGGKNNSFSAEINPSNLKAIEKDARAFVNPQFGKLPLSFEENRGQINGQAKFISRNKRYELRLTSTQAALHLADSAMLNLKLIGANRKVKMVGLDEMQGKSNYFTSSNPQNWRTGISNYLQVKCESIYPGIDLVYYGNQQQLEYDFKLAPGANPALIAVSFEGARSLRIDHRGDLVLDTASGEVRQHKPVIYQLENGVKKIIDGGYRLKGKNIVSFKIGSYDPSKPLIIDPVLAYSSYLGGNTATDIAVDAEGNSYITGSVGLLPGTSRNDVFVMKLNAAGNQIIYFTRIGGDNFDSGSGIAVDAAGNAYVAGNTSSSDFPTTQDSFKPIGQGPSTSFVIKLDSSGNVVYSTYLANGDSGGRYIDSRGIAIDSLGSAYVVGVTTSANLPTTPGAFKTIFDNKTEGFLVKLNASGSTLIYSTYFDGFASSVDVDLAGNAYVSGSARADYHTTSGAFQTTFNSENGSGSRDAFVTKFNPTGSGLLYSTYLGGSSSDAAYDVEVDSIGNAYVVGGTDSLDFPTTDGAFLRISRGFDGYVAKLNPTGSALLYATRIGGSNMDSVYNIALDSTGNVFVSGNTQSVDFPLINGVQRSNASGPIFKSTNGGNEWSASSQGLTNNAIQEIVVDPVNSLTVYAVSNAGLHKGIFKSTNGGEIWKAINTGLVDMDVRKLAIASSPVNHLYAATLSGVFKSTNGGESWSISLDGASSTALAIDPTNSLIVYAGADQGRIAKTTNGGLSWNFINLSSSTRLSVDGLAIDPTNPRTIYAGTISRSGFEGSANAAFFKSTDGGTTWSLFPRPAVYPFLSFSLVVASSTTVYALFQDDGIFKRVGEGSWTEANNGLPAAVNSLVVDPANPSILYASLGYGSVGGVYKSTNGGDSWSPTGLKDVPVKALASDPKNPSTFYAATNTMTSDAFVAKLNAAGSAMFYSTYLGGFLDENIFYSGLAVDSAGNALLAGQTRSQNFPTINALNSASADNYSDGFVAKITPSQEVAAPKITNAFVTGKHLIINGENFSHRAMILLNGEPQKTLGDEVNPNGELFGKKVGKRIGRGQSVTLQVQNSDGTLSVPFAFTRPID